MSGTVIPIDHLVKSWQTTWTVRYRDTWRVANDGKFYPRKPVKVERKDIDELEVATVR
jgi:hypothetical protein